MADRRRVAITGIGAVTPIGITRDAMWDGLRARPLGRAPGHALRLRRSFAARSPPRSTFTRRTSSRSGSVKRLDRFGQFTVACGAARASRTRELDLAREDRERVGSMMGSALGGVGYAEEQFGVFHRRRASRRRRSALATNVFGGAASCNIAIEFGAQGPNSTNAMSCASGTIAIGEGFRQIRDDYADVMICGGVEAPLAPLCFGAFAIIRAMSTRNDDPAHASRPFDRDRDGFVMGEGAAVLVLEEYERAKSRGAHIYAEVVRLCVLQRRAPHDRAASRRLAGGARRCAARSTTPTSQPHEIEYVNAHGSSTPLNDPTETRAIKQRVRRSRAPSSR